MPRTASMPRSELVAKLASVFRSHGYDGASMAILSAASGLSKASLYHHFPGGKQDMAEAVLAEEGRRLQAQVLAPFVKDGDARTSLLSSLEGVAAFYEGASPECLMNSIMLGEGGQLFGGNISAAVGAWIESYARAHEAVGDDASEARGWADYAVERIQGALILCRVQQSRAPLETSLEELSADIEAL